MDSNQVSLVLPSIDYGFFDAADHGGGAPGQDDAGARNGTVAVLLRQLQPAADDHVPGGAMRLPVRHPRAQHRRLHLLAQGHPAAHTRRSSGFCSSYLVVPSFLKI